MPPSNRAHSAPLLILLVLASACGREDSARREQEVRLEISHEPPGSAPAGEPFLLGLDIRATPPLPAESAHLWHQADGDWVRLTLRPLAGTTRYEAEVPPQPRGRDVRYYFTVRSPLGETVRLPEAPEVTGAAPLVYTLTARGPHAHWAVALKCGGALLALLLVALGAGVAVRRAAARPGAGGGLVPLAALGVVIFAVAGVGGALVTSYQETGSLTRDVPVAWWLALVLWLPILVASRRWTDAGPETKPGRRRLTLLVLVPAVLGGLAVLAGFAGMV